MSSTSAGEPTLAGAAWRYRWLVLLLLASFTAAGVLYAEARALVFTATGTVVLQDPHAAPVFGTAAAVAPDRYASDQITVLKSPQLAAAAAAVGEKRTPPLGLSASEVSAHTIVSGTPSNGSAVQITFTAADEATALAGLDSIKSAYEQTVQDAVRGQLAGLLAQIDSQLSAIAGQLASLRAGAPSDGTLGQQQAALLARRDTLNTKRDQILVDASSGPTGVTLYLPPQTASHNSKLATGLPLISVAGVLGLVAGVLIAYLLASKRRRIRSRDEPELVLGVPRIADIPRLGRGQQPLPAVQGRREMPAAVAFRSAALYLEARQVGSAASTAREAPRRGRIATAQRLVVVSAGRQEGRSLVAANLGLALAESGLSTLLIDADPATSGVSRLLEGQFELEHAPDRPEHGGENAPAEFDLTAAMPLSHPDGGMTLRNVVRPGHSRVRLALLEVGHAPHALDNDERDQRLRTLEAAFSVVIIDGTPLNEAGPYWPLVRRADGALVVVAHETSAAHLEDLANLLQAVGITPLGYVYNHPPRRRRRRARAGTVTKAPASPPPAPRQDLKVSA